ncbi:MAG: response regulator, partial [Deltaproteobacteria bacterium]|nr:response regulator [Deltaproteobacteria bacterium]
IEYVSPSVERITGYSPEEFYQNPEVWAKVVAGNDLSLVGEIISSLLAQSTTPFGDEAGSLLRRVSSKADMPGGLFLLQLSHQDGRIVPTEQQVVPVYDGRGRVVAIEGICRDISDRVRAEDEKEKLAEQLLQSQKMEALGLLAGGVAHDMNNVLAAIMGVASLLHRRLRGDNSNAAFLETILSSCKRGRDLTRNLLGFARKRMMRKDRVCLNQVVDNVVSLLGMTLPKGIAVDKSLEPVLPAIEGDSGHLEQVLMNLCINASDAIGQSGTIRVSTSVAQLTEDNLTANPEATPGTFVELRVVDSGEGMDRETMERVFEPFFTTKEQGKGTGLGMSMVYGAVRGHGGFVTIESDVGNGTTVTLRFPVTGASANNEAKVLEPKSNLDPGGKTVLLVDDEEAVRQIGKAMLEELGYRVLVAEGGEVACHIYEEQGDTIALVVLDFAMPGMDGGATYMRLREIAPNLLVLFASAYGQDSLPDYLVQKEIGEVLQKPFSIDELALAVSRVLGSEK